MKHLKFNTDDYENDCVPESDAVQFGTRSGETSYSSLHAKREIG